MSYLLALDQGTTSSRALVLDRDGQVKGAAQQTFAQHYPQPGWVEHDPAEILATQFDCARTALERAGVAASALAAVGITNQRETTLLWERSTGRALAPAIVWQDRRTAAACDRLREAGHADTIRASTGLEVDAYFSATKLAWLLDHVPGARARARAGELAFGTVDSWLVWHLSGGALHVTDAGNASRTMLFNIHRCEWDETLLALLDIPPALLPRVVDSSGVCGTTCAEVLGAAVPIAGIGGDQQAATFGQACFAPGMAKNTYGTGCFLLMNTGAAPVTSTNRLLTTIGWRSRGETCYALEGSIFIGGALVQWLRDGLGLIRRAEDVEALAASVPDSEGVVLVPAFTGLGAPYWDAYARGTLFGLTRGTGAAHIARAALEAIALQTVDLVAAMDRDGAGPLAELRVDGGAAANDLLMQIQADLLGVPVVRPKMLETTALGAAYLAGLGVGMWSGIEELASHWRAERRFEPVMAEDRREAAIARWRRAVERARGWVAA
ncbi:glycerol kinase GlpK [Aromatoleum aromaticum]|uniref:Glycerol kinase n=1 Tax=Aromatoleum aromaticum (strain DSM 19018 / LMG 30748 / EbN1) TaxID=76114 RepID=GLPK_AROAE|nr:glycerol kinase GlpK [Aromatoleum aromaticum]Q5P212.1 RecName: Full=Glycerol kinase; AltName: Full=ATP:glycerol 3-phosphotransferase; AltName: Full=Glycerokinase; Short=GK [Aromatoleum aromaticum EbN1]NMG55025.1 glycerol kinase GlpK [Aromatoleum aromaticum]CAI08652.1 Glycerol kinase [Aromatoleum aromaticum EbN1]